MNLSRQDRINRIRSVRHFSVTDSSIDSLLRQAEAAAAFIRSHDPDDLDGGHFTQYLQELKAIREHGAEKFSADGNLEPAQALLYTFIRRLHEIAADFNAQWQNYATWYLQQKLGMQPLPVENHKICLHFAKSVNEPVELKKGDAFHLAGAGAEMPAYRLAEDFTIENTTIEKIISIYFNRQKDIQPAARLGFVTSLQVRELPDGGTGENPLFSGNSTPAHTRPLGFTLTSPSLLLREGKRTVTLTLENSSPVEIPHIPEIPGFSVKLLHNIFYIRISTAGGWQKVENYAVKREGANNENLVLKLTLPEDFPATTSCQPDTHNLRSGNPALRIYLNYDAWLYPYSWLSRLSLRKIHIKTEVEGISNLQVYNELGKIDCSKPFMPFGVNTGKGALTVIGNYEMSVKPVRHINLHIHWGDLPPDPHGFRDYYAGYGTPTDNTSFRVQASYLSEGRWKAGREYPLFGADPGATLSSETVLRSINVEKMPVKHLPEESYDYSIHSKSGFISLMLTSPEMGFGEKQYRKAFAEYILQAARAKSLFRKKKPPAPNEPYRPLINQLKLDYVSEETTDLHTQSIGPSATLCHTSPPGNRQIYPFGSENSEYSPVSRTDTPASILLALKNVRKGSTLNFYIDFHSLNREINLDEIPQITWHLGDGDHWEAIPNGCVGPDKTTNLLESGFITFKLPEDLPDTLFDENGHLWLRAAIEKNESVIPSIKNIFVNVAEARAQADERSGTACNPLALVHTQWKAGQYTAGLGEIHAIATYSGNAAETDEQRLIRLSEYATHRGKAVTARDYERMTLQHFPDIASVKCLPTFRAKTGRKSDITLIIIPREKEKHSNRYIATSRQILKVEAFFEGRTPAAVRFVDVINPFYEEVLVRCRVTFKKRYPAASCRTSLISLLNSFIAPWQQSEELPQFDRPLNMQTMQWKILEQEYVTTVEQLSIVIISGKDENAHTLYEYGKDNEIHPTRPNAIFIPAGEHLITVNTVTGFGISEMTVDDSFIIT